MRANYSNWAQADTSNDPVVGVDSERRSAPFFILSHTGAINTVRLGKIPCLKWLFTFEITFLLSITPPQGAETLKMNQLIINALKPTEQKISVNRRISMAAIIVLISAAIANFAIIWGGRVNYTTSKVAVFDSERLYGADREYTSVISEKISSYEIICLSFLMLSGAYFSRHISQTKKTYNKTCRFKTYTGPFYYIKKYIGIRNSVHFLRCSIRKMETVYSICSKNK